MARRGHCFLSHPWCLAGRESWSKQDSDPSCRSAVEEMQKGRLFSWNKSKNTVVAGPQWEAASHLWFSAPFPFGRMKQGGSQWFTSASTCCSGRCRGILPGPCALAPSSRVHSPLNSVPPPAGRHQARGAGTEPARLKLGNLSSRRIPKEFHPLPVSPIPIATHPINRGRFDARIEKSARPWRQRNPPRTGPTLSR